MPAALNVTAPVVAAMLVSIRAVAPGLTLPKSTAPPGILIPGDAVIIWSALLYKLANCPANEVGQHGPCRPAGP
jgi:hypothetical protein